MDTGRARVAAIALLIGLSQCAASLAGAFEGAVVRAADASPAVPSVVPSPTAPPAATPAPLQQPAQSELVDVAATDLPPSPASTAAAHATIGSLADDAFDIVHQLPAEDWEIDALADSLDDDPARAFQFVRDSIGFQAYPGILRGADGTLAAHAGNAEDRALLLGALLGAMQVRYRFAWGDLDPATAQRVAARTFDDPAIPLAATDGSRMVRPDTTALGQRARRDDALLRIALGDRLDAASGGPAPDLASEVRHHVWVQMDLGPTWLDEDPTLAEARPGQTLTTAAGTGPTLPDGDRQTVTVEVLDQTLQDGQLVDSTVLQQTLDAADAAPSEIFLYFQPSVGGLGGSISKVLGAATSYTPVLLVNGSATPGTAFPVKPGKDLFSGDLSTTDPVIAGLRLRVTLTAPGVAPQSATRVLLDRVPTGHVPGAPLTRDQLAPLPGESTVPDVFAAVHHIAVSAGATSLRAVAAQQGAVLDFLGRVRPEDEGEFGLGSMLWPFAVSDLGMIATSEHVLVPAISDGTATRAYIASPRVYLVSLGPDASGGVDSTVDLLLDGVRIVAPTGVAGSQVALQRLWYGVLQSALETEQALTAISAEDPANSSLTGASLSMGQPLRVLGGAEAGTLASGAPQALRDDVASGQLVVVPGPVDGAEVWWTIDPVTGATRSVLDPGLGGVAAAQPTGPTTVADTIQGKVNGAGSRFARSYPGQGATNNPGRAWNGTGQGSANSYWDGDKYTQLNRPGPPPSRCGGGSEYVTLVGCVSTPMAWALRATAFAAVSVALYCVYELFDFWWNG